MRIISIGYFSSIWLVSVVSTCPTSLSHPPYLPLTPFISYHHHHHHPSELGEVSPISWFTLVILVCINWFRAAVVDPTAQRPRYPYRTLLLNFHSSSLFYAPTHTPFNTPFNHPLSPHCHLCQMHQRSHVLL